MMDKASRIAELSDIKQALWAKRLQGKRENSITAQQIPLRKDTSSAPLSFGQERLWFMDQLQPENPVYNMPAQIRLSGRLDKRALINSLQTIVRRHEVLRTQFQVKDGQVRQLIVPDLLVQIPEVDLRGMSPVDREKEMQRLLLTGARQTLDLSQGPLLAATLLVLAEDEHVLVVTVHHIVFDGWSMHIFSKELVELYKAFTNGTETTLPPPVIQYGDYAEWQREVMADDKLQKLLSYWKERLCHIPATLELPADYPRKPIQSYNGAVTQMLLPNSLREQLEELGRSEGATLFMTLLAVFKVLLYRYTGQQEIAVGTPVTNRNRMELEQLIGLVSNTLVLNSHLEDNLTIKDLLKRVRDGTVGAYAHQDLPFEKLVEELQPERDLSYHPLFQVMFNLHNYPGFSFELPELRMELTEIDNQTAKFDLMVEWVEAADGFLCKLQYNADLFAQATIERLAQHYRNLLEGAVANPHMSIRLLSLMSEDEKCKVLDEWSSGPVENLNSLPIHTCVEHQVAYTPQRTAVMYEDEAWSYRMLNERANQIAHSLLRRQVAPETPIGVYMDRSLDLVAAILGILKAGGTYVPIDPSYPAQRIAYIVQNSGLSLLLTQQHLANIDLPDVMKLCVDSDELAWNELERTNPDVSVNPDHLMYIIYTSGSTGEPKGVMNTHRAVHNRLNWMQSSYALTASDRVLQKTPISFDVSVWEFFWPLMSGATLVMARPEGHKDTGYLAKVIQERSITTIHFVPSMLHAFLANEQARRCRSLARVICSGESLTYELIEAFSRLLPAELYNLYGPTEAAIDVSAWRCVKEENRAVVPIGKPITNTRLYVLDSMLQPVPEGVTGELYIGGIQVARGYCNKPDLTAASFVPDPFSSDPWARLYKTGDLARFRGDGNLEFLGRIDHQVKLRGCRIELAEVEHVLLQHPEIRQVVVMAMEHSPGDTRLVAYVVAAKEASLTTEALRAFVQEQLPEYMIPNAFIMMEQLPLLSNGKVDRRALPKTFLSTEQAYAAPQTSVEIVLSQLWAEVLGVKKVGLHDSFFELGGHSLLATQITTRMKEHLHVDMPLAYIYQGRTVAGMIDLLFRDDKQRQKLEKICELLMQLAEMSEETAVAMLKGEASESMGGGRV